MKRHLARKALLALALAACAVGARAQTNPNTATPQTAATQPATTAEARPGEPHVPLAQPAVAYDVAGREALQGRLRTQALSGTPEAPVRNTRLVVENRSPLFYNYVAGWATFYDADGVRCGEGQWKLEAFAPQEQAEVDTPGLRLTCTPATWRLAATTLLTRAGDVAKPGEETATAEGGNQSAATNTAPASNAAQSAPAAGSTPTATALPPLEINVNGKTIPLQLGNPLEIVVGKERVRIVVQPAP